MSAGCVRTPADALATLAGKLPLGTPVDVRTEVQYARIAPTLAEASEQAREVEPLGRAPKVKFLRDGNERSQLSKLHRRR